MHTYTDLCLAHPLATWTLFDIVVNSAYALLTMPITYKPTNVVNSPFIRYSGTSAYNIYIKVDTFGGWLLLLRSFLVSFSCRLWPFGSLAVEELPDCSKRPSAFRSRSSSLPFAPRKPHCLESISTEPFLQLDFTKPYHADRQDLTLKKSSSRRLNTGSALLVDRRQLLHLLRWAPQLPALPQLAFVATLKVLKYPVP